MYDYRKALESFEKAQKIKQDKKEHFDSLQKAVGAHYMNVEFNVENITVNCYYYNGVFKICEDDIEIWPEENSEEDESISISLQSLKCKVNYGWK